MTILFNETEIYYIIAKIMNVLEHLLHLQLVIAHLVTGLDSHDHIKPSFCELNFPHHGELNTGSIFKAFHVLGLWF